MRPTAPTATHFPPLRQTRREPVPNRRRENENARETGTVQEGRERERGKGTRRKWSGKGGETKGGWRWEEGRTLLCIYSNGIILGVLAPGRGTSFSIIIPGEYVRSAIPSIIFVEEDL